MPILAYGSLGDILSGAGLEAAIAEDELPGVTLAQYMILDIREPFFQRTAEVYLFGVAADSSGEVHVVPAGQDQLDKKDVLLTKQVREGEVVEYMGHGLPLVLPPVKGFLMLRLLVADDDSKARDAAEVIKVVAGGVSSKEAVTLLVAAGLPQAAAVAAVVGKSLEAAAKMMEKNRDDLIETFEGYFTAADLAKGEPLVVKQPHAEATFNFV